VSQKTKDFLEQLKAGGEAAVGALEAIRDGVQAVAPGLSLSSILGDIGAELKQQASHGAHELAAGLFRGTDAFVLYPRTNQADGPEQSQAEKQQQELDRGGREM